MTAKQRHREAAFRRWAGEHNLGHCFHEGDECYGRIQAMHYPISVVRLEDEYRKRELLGHTDHPILSRPLDEWIADGRNSALGCVLHHGRVDLLGLVIPLEPCHIQFATEAGLEHLVLEKEAA